MQEPLKPVQLKDNSQRIVPLKARLHCKSVVATDSPWCVILSFRQIRQLYRIYYALNLKISACPSGDAGGPRPMELQVG